MFVDALTALCRQSGALLLAETSSQLRCWSGTEALGAFDTLWRTEHGRSALRPDFVLQLGSTPVSTGWERLCATESLRRIVVHPWDWVDATSNAEAIIQAVYKLRAGSV